MKLVWKEKLNEYRIIHFFGLKIVYKKKDLKLEIDRRVSQALNYVIDITQVPKAKGTLRKLQIADTLLLKMFHNICEKHNIKYFLAAGTLLGAIRHNGFIPWDDDLDIHIFYEDYEKLVSILNEELKNSNFMLWGVDNTRYGNATLRISHKEAQSVNLDIFYLHSSALELRGGGKDDLEKIWNTFHLKYYQKFKKERVKKKANYELLKKFKDSIDIPFENKINSCSVENAKTFINQVSSDKLIYSKEMIFPLKFHKFEEYEFYVPQNCDEVLKETYGDYMSFPPQIQSHDFSKMDNSKIDTAIKDILEKIH